MRILFALMFMPSLAMASGPGCFEDWFCFTLQPAGDDYQVILQRERPSPVVVVLKSGIAGGAIVQPLDDNSPHRLGKVSSQRAFWHSMRVSWNAGTLGAQHDDSVRYTYPLKSEIDVVQGFNGAFSHQGASRFAIDFDVPVGTPVYAARAGRVIDAKESSDKGGPTEDFARYANYVVVLHDDGTTGEYYHLKLNGVAVAIGQQVNTGDLLGYSGETGFASLPHLHFGVYRINNDGKFQSVKFQFASSAP